MDKYSLVHPVIRGVEPSPRSSCITIELPAERTPFSSSLLVLGGWCRGECNGVVSDQYYMDAYHLFVEMDETLLSLGSQRITLDWRPCHLNGSPPCDRVGQSATLCKDHIIVFGGGRLWTDGTVYNDLFSINILTWSWNKLTPSGTPPSPRQGHTAIPLPNGVDMAIIGGTSNAGIGPFDELFILHDTSGAIHGGAKAFRWSVPAQATPLPCPLAYMSVAVVAGDINSGSNDRALLFGGSSWNDYLSYESADLFSFDMTTTAVEEILFSSSTQIPPAGRPHSRFLHAACVIDDVMVIHGGWGFDPVDGNALFFSDCWAYNMTAKHWSKRQDISGPLGQRFGHSLVHLHHLKVVLALMGSDGMNHRSGVTVLSSYTPLEQDSALLACLQRSSSGTEDIQADVEGILTRRYVYSERGVTGDILHLLQSGDVPSGRGDCVDGSDEGIVRCHKCILAARSEVFSNMFSLAYREANHDIIRVEGTNFSSFKAFLKCVYGADIKEAVAVDSVVDVLELADRFQVMDVKFLCESYVCLQVDSHNVCDLCRLADIYNCPYLFRRCLCIMRELCSSPNTSEAFWADLTRLQVDGPALFVHCDIRRTLSDGSGGEYADKMSHSSDSNDTRPANPKKRSRKR